MVEALCIISLYILLWRLAFTKCCWHFYLLMRFQSSIDNWTKTQWRQINVEQMDVELRRFAKASSITVGYDDLSSSAPPPSIFPDLVAGVLGCVSLFTSHRMIRDSLSPSPPIPQSVALLIKPPSLRMSGKSILGLMISWVATIIKSFLKLSRMRVLRWRVVLGSEVRLIKAFEFFS